jgi:GAF domain-containing protein
LVTGDPHVVFYTGVPIVTGDGLALGTLCVIDNQPRELSAEQMKALKALSNQVMQLLELRRNKLILEEKNHFLNQFAAVAAHDIKAPLHNLNMLADLLLTEHAQSFQTDHVQYLKMISSAVGLIVFMIAHIGYNLMISRINKVVNKMEAHAIEFLDILEEPTH